MFDNWKVYINGNPTLIEEQAKLILNRVGGTNRVVGRNKIDMIFNSPNGIYLDRTKFTGFKDVIIFTTVPVNLDEKGNIRTLTIDKGNIEVGRKDLDTSKLEQFFLFSKQISVDGEVRRKKILI